MKHFESERTSAKSQNWRSSGREPYVFRVDRPGDLRGLHIGVHADLMEKTLRRDEELLYLLYSPIFPGKEGPFGLHATPASHAVAVTKYRFIISEDRHMGGIAPTVQSIPFGQILYVQVGTALSLGWFSVEFIANHKPSCMTLFFTATGIEHFEALIREYRRITAANCGQLTEKIDWVDIWGRTPMTQVDRLKSLVLKEENPFNSVRSSELWCLEKKRWEKIPVYLSTNGILVSTNLGFIHATDEPCIRPKIYSFGVNVSCISFDALKSVRVLEKRMYGNHLYSLRLETGRGPVAIDYDVPFNENSLNDAEDLVCFLKQNIRVEREVCIS